MGAPGHQRCGVKAKIRLKLCWLAELWPQHHGPVQGKPELVREDRRWRGEEAAFDGAKFLEQIKSNWGGRAAPNTRFCDEDIRKLETLPWLRRLFAASS